MDWMLLTEMSSMFYGPWPTAPSTAEAASTATTAATADLWIAQQAYEFMAPRTLCERCGAPLARKVSVAHALDGALDGADHIGTDHIGTDHITITARCRGWRRHPHTALVSRGRDGLRFGALEPS